MVEFCLAKCWANLGSVEADYSVTFHGLKPSLTNIVMHGGEGIMRLDLASGLKAEEAAPEIKLKNVVQVVRPSDSKIFSMSDVRDVLPAGRQMLELQLSFSFSISKTAEQSLNLSMLSDCLYESQMESQMWMLYDSNKTFIVCRDAYPNRWSLKLEKRDHTAEEAYQLQFTNSTYNRASSPGSWSA